MGESSQDKVESSALIVNKSLDAINETTSGRSGGAYVPPARLRMLQQQQLLNERVDSEVVQRISWEALKKSINGLINKVNSTNIRAIIPELFSEDLIRGRGLFCRSLMKAQSLALPFTPIYAAVVAVINSRLPRVGELLIHRVIYQFRRAYRRNDRTPCLALLTLLAHLTNQKVVTEFIVLQILALLLERPTADSVELAVGLSRECGQFLTEEHPKSFNLVFERFRSILHQAEVDKRVQYMIEVLFQVRKDKFKDNPIVDPDLDLVEEDDKITHNVSLDDEIDPQDILNVFNLDPNYLESQEAFKKSKEGILGSEDESSEGEEGSSEEESEEEVEENKGMEIVDKTGTNLVNLRRTIYLTVMSSLNYEECAHKLLKMNIAAEDEVELCTMIIECCSQERTYTNFYGNLGERFCKLNRKWAEHFEHVFKDTYETIHRYETNKIRSIAKFFAHLIAKDAIPMPALGIICLTEELTTASSRIFIKILFQELVGHFGINSLNKILKDPALYPAIQPGLFPMDNPKNTRFAINYYTSIGLGEMTEELRNHLQELNQRALNKIEEDSSSGDSSSEESSSDDSSSESERSPVRKRVSPIRRAPVSPSPIRRAVRHRSNSRSPPRYISNRNQFRPLPTSNYRNRSRSASRSISPRNIRKNRNFSRSISPRNQRRRSITPVHRRGRQASRSISVKREERKGRPLSRSNSGNRGERRGRPISRSASVRREDRRPRSRSASIKREKHRDRSISRSITPIRDVRRGRQVSRSISPRKGLRRPVSRSVSPKREIIRRAVPRYASPRRQELRRRSVSRSISPRRERFRTNSLSREEVRGRSISRNISIKKEQIRGRSRSRSNSVRRNESRGRSISRSVSLNRRQVRDRPLSRSISPRRVQHRGRSVSRSISPRRRYRRSVSKSISPRRAVRRGRSVLRSISVKREKCDKSTSRNRSRSGSIRNGRNYSRSISPRGRNYSRSISPRGRNYSHSPVTKRIR